MPGWLTWIGDSTPFLTRGHCGPWPPALQYAYILANLAIAIAYFGIPACLAYYWRERREELSARASRVLVLFVAFISLCGLTHLADVLVFWWAPYRLFTAVLIAAAGTSLATLAILPGVVRYAVRLPSREKVHALNNQLHLQGLDARVLREQLAARNVELERKVRELQHEISTRGWIARKDEELEGIRAKFAGVIDAIRGDS